MLTQQELTALDVFEGVESIRAIDSQSRTTLATEWRLLVEGAGPLHLFPMPHQNPDSAEAGDVYLKLFSNDSFALHMERMFPGTAASQQATMAKRRFMRLRQIVSFDNQWRFKIRPEHVAMLAPKDGKAPAELVFVGVGDGIEAWHPETYNRLVLGLDEKGVSPFAAFPLPVFDDEAEAT